MTPLRIVRTAFVLLAMNACSTVSPGQPRDGDVTMPDTYLHRRFPMANTGVPSCEFVPSPKGHIQRRRTLPHLPAQPDALDLNLGTRYYVLQWRGVDAWNNLSSPRYTRFCVVPDAATTTCGAPRHVEMIVDEPW
jgi:hypothetical protein